MPQTSNGDGKLDLVVSSASGFKVYLGNGDGTFQGGGITSGQIVSIADINGDGVLDLISGAEGRNPVVVVWFGAGNGAFNGPVTLAVRPAAPEFAAVGDFNGDGAQDLVVPFDGSSSDTTSKDIIFLNTGGDSVKLASSANPSKFGQAVTFTVTVAATVPGSGTPGGTVQFTDGNTVLATMTLSKGKATFTTSSLSVGSHPMRAVYAGNSKFNPKKSAVLTQTVNP